MSEYQDRIEHAISLLRELKEEDKMAYVVFVEKQDRVEQGSCLTSINSLKYLVGAFANTMQEYFLKLKVVLLENNFDEGNINNSIELAKKEICMMVYELLFGKEEHDNVIH